MITERTGIRHNQQGSALIITLLMVSILISLVVNFVYEVHIDSSSLANWSNAQRASIIARSGQALGSRYLDKITEYTYTNEREIELPIDQYLGTNSKLKVVIEDENSKFNINSIIYENGSTDEKALSSLKKLLDYLNINSDLALLLADWIDPDSEPRLPYSEDTAKDTFFWSVDELILVKGIDKDTFEKIIPYITVSEKWGRKININTAEIPVLVSLHKDMTETLAKRIVEYRENSPFEEWSQVQRVSGMKTIGQELAGTVQSKSTEFRITSTATVNEITRVIESIIDTSKTVFFWREG
ncbi:MAG TPA: general secretion pathway protein GspK [Nitrospirae bacterium]|nr:general secretion pathway protein K [bacterium BMS3Abin09]GBE40444.1 general secretion pathway protein K [bacterium BMS3Bbin09]HDN95268.1 general secretion pathway protein GspK [Nitrospirota bacterium]HDZ83666.1 general secretion pathway protein GspK [Nitrospirota bacterium]